MFGPWIAQRDEQQVVRFEQLRAEGRTDLDVRLLRISVLEYSQSHECLFCRVSQLLAHAAFPAFSCCARDWMRR